ncbi:MAG: hypothetical protein V4603_03625 [Pseudomonadota bacterium]
MSDQVEAVAGKQVDPEVQSGARWFWWIAGLSLVNAVMYYTGSDVSFVVGLAMTALTSLFFTNMVVAFVVIAMLIGFYFAMGYLAQQGVLWAFYAGLGVYVVDGLIYLMFQDWMSVAFHVFAGFSIVKGMLRAQKLNAQTATTAA